MRKLFALTYVVVLCCATPAHAQNPNSDRCEVAALDMTAKKSDKDQGKQLGTFETVMGEEELTTKFYRLPKTKLFVVASVFYTDESMASKKGADSISLELMVSTKRKRDVLSSLVFAEAEMPLHDFDIGRVTAMVKTGRRTIMLMMECKENIRR